MTQLRSITPCPCGSKQSYSLCCAPFHKGRKHAPTAETLMRSRYSAYVSNHAKYIFRTWDKQTRPSLKSLLEENHQQFIGLSIISTSKGGTNDEEGTVEFIAEYALTNKSTSNMDTTIYQHHENSFFVKQKNQWKYVEPLRNMKKLKQRCK